MTRIQSAGSISPLIGIAFMIFGGMLLTTHNAGLKWLTNDLPIGQIMTLRAVFAFIPILLIAWRSGGRRSLRIRNFHAQAARALCFAGAAFLWLLGLRYLPLTDAMSISFTAPIVVTALAPFVLGENRRLAPVGGRCCRFLWRAVDDQPNGRGPAGGVFLPLAAVAGAVGRDLITRRIASTESSVATLAFTTGVIGASGW